MVALAATLAGYFYLTSSSRISRVAARILRQAIGADVTVQSARYQSNGTLLLEGIAVTVPTLDEPGGRFFTAEQVEIDQDLWALFAGSFEARSLNFIKPTVYITEDLDAGRFNYEFLQPQREDASFSLPQRLPEIVLKDGAVHFGSIERGQYTPSDTIHIDGNLTSVPAKRSAYFFTLQQMAKDSDGPLLKGVFDLERVSFESELENFAFESPHRNLLKQEWRRFWDLLEPRGEFPTIRVTFNPLQGLRAELALRNVELGLPFGQVDSRIEVQSARFLVAGQTWPVQSNQEAMVMITDLKGRIEDIHYVINGKIFGFDADAPFELRIDSDGALYDQTDLMALPEKVQKIFRLFEPTGQVKGSVTIARKERGGKITYNGKLDVVGDIEYARFPYPLKKVQGTVVVNDDQVRFGPLTGKGPTGASVTIEGTITPSADGAAVDATITTVRLPLDDVLFEAMKPGESRVARAFMDQAAYQQLHEAGLIQSRPEQAHRRQELKQLAAQIKELDRESDNGDALNELRSRTATLQQQVNLPLFDLGGTIETVSSVVREQGAGKRSHTRSEFDLAGMESLFEHWPYPLRVTRGKLIIEPGRIVLQDAHGTGLTGGEIELSGWIDVSGKGFEPHLDIVAKDLPIDEFLFQSLPEPEVAWVRNFHPTGTLNGSGRIFHNDEDVIDFLLDLRVTNGTARPYGQAFHLEQVAGRFTLQRGKIQIHELAAQHKTSRVQLSGHALWPTERPSIDFTVRGEHLRFEDPLLDLFPQNDRDAQALKKLFERYQPEGEFAAQLKLTTDERSRRQYVLTLHPLSLAFDFNSTRVTLHDMSGQARITPGLAELKNLAGSFGDGSFAIDGTVRLADKLDVDLTFDAQNRRCCPMTKAVLPRPVLTTIEGLKLDGAYQIHGARLRVRSESADRSEVQFDAHMTVKDGEALVGVPITQIEGDLQIQALSRSSEPFPNLELTFNARHLLALHRVISPLSIEMVSNTQQNRLDIRQLAGRCYDGTLIGRGTIQLDDHGRYALELGVQDVAFGPFIRADPATFSSSTSTENDTAPDEPPSGGGVLSASLTLEGVPNDPSSRRGRGDMLVSNARLYDVPLVLTVLQILNLSIPTSTSFDRATANYLVDANVVRFDRASLIAPTVEIVGAGTMQYNTRELDLVMFNRSPEGPILGPLSELWNKFKDELACVRVSGTLGNPKAELDSFRGIRQSWEEFFGASRPINQPLVGTARTSGQ